MSTPTASTEMEDGSGRLVFYDDAQARTFEPFALSRPLCEMRVGALLMRERWETALKASSSGFVGAPQLSGFTEAGAPGSLDGVIAAGTVLVNSRAAIALADIRLAIAKDNDAKDRVWYVGGKLAAVQLQRELKVSALHDGTLSLEAVAASNALNSVPVASLNELDAAPAAALNELDGASAAASQTDNAAKVHAGRRIDVQNMHTGGRVDVQGVWLEEVWDIVRHLSPLLCEDVPALAATLPCAMPERGPLGPIVIGSHAVHVESGAVIEPYTVFDTSLGPVLMRAGSTVQALTRVVGPCYIGHSSTVMGDRVGGSAIGDNCRVHGEVSATVFVGHSNKGHDGFVGHSIVGRWVNMGAGTTTSNLKNTYGTVALWTPSGVRDTGLQFLGTMFGDHVKTGIGLKLTTGCVLGMAANVFDAMPSKVVEPFAWGSGAPYDSYDANKFLETAARMMMRRHVELSDAGRLALKAIHAARWRAS